MNDTCPHKGQRFMQVLHIVFFLVPSASPLHYNIPIVRDQLISSVNYNMSIVEEE